MPRNPFDDDSTVENASSTAPPTTAYTSSDRTHTTATTTTAPHDPLLDTYETQLKKSISPTFFNDPPNFQALNLVIEIIGAGMASENSNNNSSIGTNYEHVPKYQQLKRQQRLVEEAIEHMAIRHCADLNSSVAAVGRMSRQFDEAKLRVRSLRRQVRDVKDSLRLGELGMGDLVRNL